MDNTTLVESASAMLKRAAIKPKLEHETSLEESCRRNTIR